MKKLTPVQVALRERFKPVIDRAKPPEEPKAVKTIAAEETIAASADLSHEPPKE